MVTHCLRAENNSGFTADYDALKAAGYLTSITWDNFTTHTRDTYYDAHNPGAREMYWQQARDSLIRRDGWDAWWVDQCEPDTEDPNNRKKSRFFTGRGLDYFNSYSLVHTTGIYEHWRRDIPKKRVFLLAEYATERPADTLELRIYPGADGSFTLYEDENDNYDYERGKYATIRMDWDDRARQLTIHAEGSSKTFS